MYLTLTYCKLLVIDSFSQYDIHSISTSHLTSLNFNQKTIRLISVAATVAKVVELCKRDVKPNVVAASLFKFSISSVIIAFFDSPCCRAKAEPSSSTSTMSLKSCL